MPRVAQLNWEYIGEKSFVILEIFWNRPPGLTRASQKTVHFANFIKINGGMLEMYWSCLDANIKRAKYAFQYLSKISPLNFYGIWPSLKIFDWHW